MPLRAAPPSASAAFDPPPDPDTAIAEITLGTDSDERGAPPVPTPLEAGVGEQVTQSPIGSDRAAPQAGTLDARSTGGEGLGSGSGSGPGSNSPSSSPSPTYGRVAARGMVWAALVAMWTKGAAFITNLVLGWLLNKDDFGLFAIAVGLTAIAIVISDGGTMRLLRRPEEYARLGRSVATISLASMFFFGGLIAAIAFPAASYYGDQRLAWMLLVIAVNMPLANRTLLLRVRLGTELRFRDIARCDAVVVAVRNVSLIGFALLGLGPLSFVLPMLLATIVDWIVLARLAPGRVPGEPLDRPTFWSVIHSSKWIALGMLAATVIHNAAPVVMRQGMSTDMVGIYYFGFQVAFAPTALLGVGLQRVMLPTMSRLAGEPARMASAYLRALRLLALASGPVAVFSAAIAGPMTHLLWQGKWDASVPVIQLLSLGISFRLASNIAGAALEARGQWRLRTNVLWIDAAAIIVAASIGTVIGSVAAVAACVWIHMFTFGVITCLVAGHQLAIPWYRTLLAATSSLLASFAAGCVAWALVEHFTAGWSDLTRAAAAVACTASAIGLAYLVAMPHRMKEVIGLLRGRGGLA